jgi:hypothetical protein
MGSRGWQICCRQWDSWLHRLQGVKRRKLAKIRLLVVEKASKDGAWSSLPARSYLYTKLDVEETIQSQTFSLINRNSTIFDHHDCSLIKVRAGYFSHWLFLTWTESHLHALIRSVDMVNPQTDAWTYFQCFCSFDSSYNLWSAPFFHSD